MFIHFRLFIWLLIKFCFFVELCLADLHWAFRPLGDPPPPKVENSYWARNEIDYFILKRMNALELYPPDKAEKQVLLRRLNYALTGLPPESPEGNLSYDRMINDLLNSEHYGEKWARHWMDVVRYSDSNGLDENLAFAHAWRYRDYLIDAFNRDIPFNEFAIEQIAGDLLCDGKPFDQANRLKVATGFLALGPKLLAEPDPVKMEMDMIDEQMDVIGQAFLGMTIGCARCHDHMSDPISMADYYAMAGIFKSTRTMKSVNRPTRWFEHVISSPEEQEYAKKHDSLIEAQEKVIEAFKEMSNYQLLATGVLHKIPRNPAIHYSNETKKELERLENVLETYQEKRPELDYCHGVTDGNVTNLRVFLRGDPDVLGDQQARGVPSFSGLFAEKPIDYNRSGRLELAQWITENCRPLFARVIANRVWHWHFGRGLVQTVDNFGSLGAKPSHPKLLDWLASRLIEDNWSLKSLHRRILRSATWQSSSKVTQQSNQLDPQNIFYSRFPIRRMEVEAIRDTWLLLAGDLNKSVGGKVFFPENRKHIFTVSSIDETKYDIGRRSIYLPVIRNHVYEFFTTFDFSDPLIVQGDRKHTPTAQQALYLLNSPMIHKISREIAESVSGPDHLVSVQNLFMKLYLRKVKQHELQDAVRFLKGFSQPSDRLQPLASLAQAMLSSNEFLYIR